MKCRSQAPSRSNAGPLPTPGSFTERTGRQTSGRGNCGDRIAGANAIRLDFASSYGNWSEPDSRMVLTNPFAARTKWTPGRPTGSARCAIHQHLPHALEDSCGSEDGIFAQH